MTRHVHAALVRLALVALAAAGAVTCVDTQSTDCPNGRVCPSGTRCAAADTVCIRDNCGDGNTDPDEVCDDGNVRDGDGCSKTCKSDETCGNGTVDTAAGEVCDDGNTHDDDG